MEGRPIRNPTLEGGGCRKSLGADLDDTENLNPAWIRSLDRPACSESLYRLRHPGRQYLHRTLVRYMVQCSSDKQTISDRRTESKQVGSAVLTAVLSK
jgi:hypothetical protein